MRMMRQSRNGYSKPENIKHYVNLKHKAKLNKQKKREIYIIKKRKQEQHIKFRFRLIVDKKYENIE